MQHQEETSRAQSGNGLRRYDSPQLVVYGALTQLTASGSGSAESDAGSMSGMTCEPAHMSHPNCPAP
jgi:hypothetical protein